MWWIESLLALLAAENSGLDQRGGEHSVAAFQATAKAVSLADALAMFTPKRR
jgi:hypothetical protein